MEYDPDKQTMSGTVGNVQWRAQARPGNTTHIPLKVLPEDSVQDGWAIIVSANGWDEMDDPDDDVKKEDGVSAGGEDATKKTATGSVQDTEQQAEEGRMQ
jgi:hypothetical protein